MSNALNSAGDEEGARAVMDPTPESAPEYDFILFFLFLNWYSGSFPCRSWHHYRNRLLWVKNHIFLGEVQSKLESCLYICLYFWKYVYVSSVKSIISLKVCDLWLKGAYSSKVAGSSSGTDSSSGTGSRSGAGSFLESAPDPALLSQWWFQFRIQKFLES